MAEPRPGPPPVPPRVDLGETEENVLDSQEHVPASTALPPTHLNGSEIAKPQPVLTAQDDKPVVTTKPAKTLPNAPSKPLTPAPFIQSTKPTPPVSKTSKPEHKREAKSRPTISIISARPMDQANSFPSVHFNNDKVHQEGNVNNNVNDEHSGSADVTLSTGIPNKPRKPAPKKPPSRPEDRDPKAADQARKSALVPNVRSKTNNPKRDSGSVFYVDTSADTSMGTKASSVSAVDISSNKAAQRPKEKKPLSAPRKPKIKDEQKTAGEIDPVTSTTKVKPPEKTVPKPKLKPTIITAKTPKPPAVVSKNDKVKNFSSEDTNASSVPKPVDENRPSRPSFPPGASTEELNKNQTQPERPKAPPNAIKEDNTAVEKKREQKPKTEQAEKKRLKSKPPRPPLAKESAKAKPSRPAPAKPNVTRKSSSKLNAVSHDLSTSTDKQALVKPSGAPRAQAKFDYSGETDDDLAFKVGDIIMLTSKVDDDWLVGYLENNVMHQGLVPSSFVEIIVALKEQPSKEQSKKSVPSEPYAVALHDFQGQSEGELSFSAGQTVILLERINFEWLKGKLNGAIGIFPANFVKIEHDLPLTASQNHVETPAETGNVKSKGNGEEWCQAVHDYQGEHADDLSFVVGAKIRIIERVSEDWFRGEYSDKCGIFPASFVEVIADAGRASLDSSLVTAIHDYPGETTDDLSFNTGDKIKVIERVNSDWLMGECDGRQGLFPASFVQEALQSESSTVIPAQSKEKEEQDQTKDVRMAKAIHDFTGENPGELHFSVGDVIQVLRDIDSNWSEGIINHVSGIFPTAFVEIQPTASKGEVYAKALYDFAGESEHDLCFKAGDLIQVLEHINEEWCSGYFGGKKGHFPSSFVEILVSR